MEVNAEDDGEGEEWVFHGKPSQASGGEIAALTSDGGEEGWLACGEVVNGYVPCFAGLGDAEMEGVVGIREGGNVEILGNHALPPPLAYRWYGVELHLAVGVGDFGNGGDRLAIFTGNVVEGNGIKSVAKDARESKELNASFSGENDSLVREPVGQVLAGGFFGIGMDVVAGVEGEEVKAVFGEKGRVRKGVEINGEHENAVGEGVFSGRDAGVAHAAFVEGWWNRQDSKVAKFWNLGI